MGTCESCIPYQDDSPEQTREKEHEKEVHKIHKTLDKYTSKVVTSITPGVRKWNNEYKYEHIPDIKQSKDCDENIKNYPLKLNTVKLLDTFDLLKADEDLHRDKKKDTAFSLLGIPLFFPICDNPETFNNENEMKMWLEEYIEMPPKNVIWDDLTTDKSMSLFAFASMGSHKTVNIQIQNEQKEEKQQYSIPENAVYKSDFTLLSNYMVRDDLNVYGAVAFFDDKYDIISIYVSYLNQTVTKNDSNPILWRHAKYVYVTSVIAFITLADHATYCHLIESNALVINTRQELPMSHPFRRLLKIFTFRTAYINQSIYKILLSKNGLVHRIWGFKYSSLTQLCKDAKTIYKYKPINKLHDESMNNVPDNIFPIKKDFSEYLDITKKFVNEYFNIYYSDDKQFENDKFLISFYNELKKSLYIVDDLNYGNDKDSFINLISELISSVTVYHEYVGAAFDYIGINCNWVDTKIYKKGGINKNNMSRNEFALSAVLVMLTGVKNPMLLNDFKHLMLKDDNLDQVTNLLDNWQNNLKQLSKDIEQRNKNRRIGFNAANPKNLECSLSI